MGKIPDAVNPAIERQLTRLRMRLAKTPLPRFFAWWGGELLACLPAKWRARLSERSEALLVDLQPEEIHVWREKGDAVSAYATIRRDLAAEEQAAEFRRLRGALEDPAANTVFVMPSAHVLSRQLTLPAAAEENLQQVLGFEMDRQTPFKADQVYFDSRVLHHDTNGRTLRAELVLMPRSQLDADLAVLPWIGRELDGVDAWSGAPGGARRGVNLLPPDRRARHRSLRLPLNLGLAALAIVLLVVNMNESLANRATAVERMRVEVEQTAKDARQVAELRKTLADSIAGANFLSDRKRKAPLMVGILNDLTVRIPLDTYLERVQFDDGQVQIQGQAQEASRLIALLGASPCLENPGFQGQVQPDARTGKDRFQINAALVECSPEAATSQKPESEAAKVTAGEVGEKAAEMEPAVTSAKDATAGEQAGGSSSTSSGAGSRPAAPESAVSEKVPGTPGQKPAREGTRGRQ